MGQMLTSITGIVTSVVLSGLLALALVDQSVSLGGWSVFTICIAVAFAIQWIAFVPSWLLHSEHFYDLTGGTTYITVVLLALFFGTSALGDGFEPRSLLLAALIIPWATRLAWFLFIRVLRAGSDQRFDNIKRSFHQLLMTWTMQGMWVSLTLAAALAAMTTAAPEQLGWVAALGVLIFLEGFLIEVIADYQKNQFRKDPENADRFINTGLWSWSRHPNYFGEILLWVGIALVAAPVLHGWQLVALISPIFVTVLLTKISGIPMLERRADKRWGEDPDYQAWKARTSVLIPLPPR